MSFPPPDVIAPILHGPFPVLLVNTLRPKTWALQPGRVRISQQCLDSPADVGVAQCVGISLPGHDVQGVHQPLVVFVRCLKRFHVAVMRPTEIEERTKDADDARGPQTALHRLRQLAQYGGLEGRNVQQMNDLRPSE